MPDWKKEFEAMSSTKEGQARLLDFMRFFVITIDEAIASGDLWFNVGLQKKSCNPQLTLHDGKDVYYASGLTLDQFLRECESL
jgi:hypothetical protein